MYKLTYYLKNPIEGGFSVHTIVVNHKELYSFLATCKKFNVIYDFEAINTN